MGGVESDYSVCPRPLLQFLQFLQFFQFMSVRLRQVTSGYVRLSQFTSEGQDVELDNIYRLYTYTPILKFPWDCDENTITQNIQNLHK